MGVVAPIDERMVMPTIGDVDLRTNGRKYIDTAPMMKRPRLEPDSDSESHSRSHSESDSDSASKVLPEKRCLRRNGRQRERKRVRTTCIKYTAEQISFLSAHW